MAHDRYLSVFTANSQTEDYLTDYQGDKIDEVITLEVSFTHFLSLTLLSTVWDHD